MPAESTPPDLETNPFQAARLSAPPARLSLVQGAPLQVERITNRKNSVELYRRARASSSRTRRLKKGSVIDEAS